MVTTNMYGVRIYREKDDNLIWKFDLLNRELRAMMSIAGELSVVFCSRPLSTYLLLLLLSTPLHQRAASRVQHPKSCGSQQSLPPGGKERLHFVGIRPEVQARKGGW